MPNKYSDHARAAIEQAPLISASMGHTYTGTEHLLLAILSKEQCVAAKILASDGIDYSKAHFLVASLVGLGVARTTDFPSFITQNFKKVLFGACQSVCPSVGIITTKNILDQMLKHQECGAYRVLSAQNVRPKSICDVDTESNTPKLCQERKTEPLPKNLQGITQDLTALCQEQEEIVIGREKEILSAFLILLRKQKNAPCFVGKAGVGKTALAKFIAYKIAIGDCPPEMLHKRILTLANFSYTNPFFLHFYHPHDDNAYFSLHNPHKP